MKTLAFTVALLLTCCVVNAAPPPYRDIYRWPLILVSADRVEQRQVNTSFTWTVDGHQQVPPVSAFQPRYWVQSHLDPTIEFLIKGRWMIEELVGDEVRVEASHYVEYDAWLYMPPECPPGS